MNSTRRTQQWTTEYGPRTTPEQAIEKLHHITEPIFRKYAVEVYLYFHNDFQRENDLIEIEMQRVNSREPVVMIRNIMQPIELPENSEILYPIVSGIKCKSRILGQTERGFALSIVYENNNIVPQPEFKTPQRRAPSPIYQRDLSPKRHSQQREFVLDSPPPQPVYHRSVSRDRQSVAPDQFRRSESIRRQLREPKDDNDERSDSYEYVEEVSDKEEQPREKKKKEGWFSLF